MADQIFPIELIEALPEVRSDGVKQKTPNCVFSSVLGDWEGVPPFGGSAYINGVLRGGTVDGVLDTVEVWLGRKEMAEIDVNFKILKIENKTSVVNPTVCEPTFYWMMIFFLKNLG